MSHQTEPMCSHHQMTIFRQQFCERMLTASLQLYQQQVYAALITTILIGPHLAILSVPYAAISVTSFAPEHHEYGHVGDWACIFGTGDNLTIWVERQYRGDLMALLLMERARAVPLNEQSPCIVRKGLTIEPCDAAHLLEEVGVENIKVMQFGQKVRLDNPTVTWVLKNVRVTQCERKKLITMTFNRLVQALQ